MTEPVLTIVLGTRNRLDMLKQSIDSIAGAVSVPHRVIVVDAGSTDGTLEYLATRNDVETVADGKPIGQAQSLNRVFRRVESKYVCWISDDNVLQPGALDDALETLERRPAVGMVALKVKDVLGPYTRLPYIGGISDARVLTCNQGVLRNDVFRRVGYFDEAFRNYGIDPDLTASVLRAGYEVVMTRRVAIHHYRDHDALPGAIQKDERVARLAAARELYAKKHATLVRAARSVPVARTAKYLLWLCIRVLVFVTRRERFFGYSFRDWTNLLHCRWISILDFWRTRREPYYLVQRIDRTLD